MLTDERFYTGFGLWGMKFPGVTKPARGVAYIYIIRCKLTNRMKIGQTTQLAQRMSAIQANCPTELGIQALLEGPVWLEEELHTEFDDCRVHGEWFDPNDRFLEFLGAARSGLVQERVDQWLFVSEDRLLPIRQRKFSEIKADFFAGIMKKRLTESKEAVELS